MTLEWFLSARIAEDEADAREAAGFEGVALSWSVAHGGNAIDPDVAPTVWAFAERHIARHDPARVLAECQAKTWIVEFVATAIAEAQRSDYPTPINAMMSSRASLGEAILRRMAAVYADHPDFDASWLADQTNVDPSLRF